ncbi:MAG: toprim domain-containing protein, partial [Clostridia bacterium]|nr:toprim domain-containing protein [Clostridia bacterium]
MDTFIEPIGRLINQFSKLPGVGKKTAQRYAYKIIDMSPEEAKQFAESILECKSKVRYCSVCGNFSEEEVCDVCKKRDKSVICVVKEPKDVIALEKLREYKGVYHVLH